MDGWMDGWMDGTSLWQVDAFDLLDLDDNDIAELGLAKLEAKRIHRAIDSLRQKLS